MNHAALLAYASAIFCGGVAFTVVWNERRLVHLLFAAGMALFALESIFNGLTWGAPMPEALGWQQWKLWADSLLPGVWLLFALSYGRGNYQEFLKRWKFLLDRKSTRLNSSHLGIS